MKTRKEKEAYVLKVVGMLDPTGNEVDRYTRKFKGMSDAQFTKWLKNIKEGVEQLYIYLPNIKNKTRLKDFIKAAKFVGISTEERIWKTDYSTGRRFLTPEKYTILRLPVRRVKQFLMDKISLPQGDTNIDTSSGQVTAQDKASSISLVEMQTLAARGLTTTAREFTKYRGGDIQGYADMKANIEETGRCVMSSLPTDTVSKANVTMDAYFRAMHLHSNFVAK